MLCPLGFPFLRTKHGNIPSWWPSSGINWQNVAKRPLWTPFGRKKFHVGYSSHWKIIIICANTLDFPQETTLCHPPLIGSYGQNSPTSLPIYDKISDLLFAQPIPGTDRLNSIVSDKLRVFCMTKVLNISRASLCATVFNLFFANASLE